MAEHNEKLSDAEKSGEIKRSITEYLATKGATLEDTPEWWANAEKWALDAKDWKEAIEQGQHVYEHRHDLPGESIDVTDTGGPDVT